MISDIYGKSYVSIHVRCLNDVIRSPGKLKQISQSMNDLMQFIWSFDRRKRMIQMLDWL